MWPIILLGLLIACLAGWFVTWQRQRNRIRQLERSKEEIQIEETLVFDFLHGLGEAFSETIRAADLHRLIVEGATRILDAHGGALYMMERAGGKLAPAYISKGCPPASSYPSGRGPCRPRLANTRTRLFDRSRKCPRVSSHARYFSRRYLGHGHAAALRETKHGRAGAR